MINRMNRWRSACALLLMLVLLIGTVADLAAAPSSKELEKKTGQLKNEIGAMDQELKELSAQLDETSAQMEETSAQLAETKIELASAISNEATQYDAMKKRIRFMYEGGSVTLLQILLTSEDMGEFLNNAEYVSNISDYDREMLDSFKAARVQVEEAEAKLQEEQSKLDTLSADLTTQSDALKSKIESSNARLSDYNKQLEHARAAELLASAKASAAAAEAAAQRLAKQAKEKQAQAAEKAKQEAAQQKVEVNLAQGEQAPATPTETPTETAGEDTEVENPGGKNLGSFRMTHYCNCKACCGQWAGGRTKTGTIPTAGRTIAVDPKVIPLGSCVMIRGQVYIAEDTGSAIKGKRIDIYVNEHAEALRKGVFYADVTLL